MTQAPDGDKRKAELKRTLVLAGLLSPFLLIFACGLYQRAGGDWSRMGPAILHSLTTAAPLFVGLLLVRVLFAVVRRRPWREWPPSLKDILEILIFVNWFMLVQHRPRAESLPTTWRPADMLTDWWVLFGPSGWFLAALLAFWGVVAWWLGFVERDRARAMARDRQGERAG